MATKMISLKLQDAFLKEIDDIADKNGYHDRTEFIRSALRDKVEEKKLKAAMMELSHLKGASKKRTSNKEIEKIRKRLFDSHLN